MWWITSWSGMLPCHRRYSMLGKDVILHAVGNTVLSGYRFDNHEYLYFYNRYLRSWKTWSPRRCGGRAQKHPELNLLGERLEVENLLDGICQCLIPGKTQAL